MRGRARRRLIRPEVFRSAYDRGSIGETGNVRKAAVSRVSCHARDREDDSSADSGTENYRGCAAGQVESREMAGTAGRNEYPSMTDGRDCYWIKCVSSVRVPGVFLRQIPESARTLRSQVRV